MVSFPTWIPRNVALLDLIICLTLLRIFPKNRYEWKAQHDIEIEKKMLKYGNITSIMDYPRNG